VHISVFDPASPQAATLLRVWNICFWICICILGVVTIAMAYILFRYRAREDREPLQIAGSTRLEAAWTAIPIGIVTLLFVLSVLAERTVDKPVRRDPDIVITGHQWWWEARYVSNGAFTANEIHIPLHEDTLIDIEAADVIHDFWVPRLARKVDAIPGHPNFIWIHADSPGEYLGACAEFCGAEHAWMRFRVEAQQPADYQAWLRAQALDAAEPSSQQAIAGRMRFRQLTCVNCHNIRGVNSQQQYAPDLTHVASRKMLAGERLENTAENMRQWLHEPNILKPNCKMPNLNLNDSDLDALTAYMETLK
jgi:cytochrome c oxidase subunit II